MYKELYLALAVAVLFSAAVAAALTGLWLWDFSAVCDGQGGTFSIEGGTAWCRY